MRATRSVFVSFVASLWLLVACGGPAGPEAGALLWTLQFGTGEADVGSAVAVADDGRIAVAGTTQGPLGGALEGGWDAFVRLLDADRAVAWTHQVGTADDDRATGVAFHPDGGLVVAGSTSGNLFGPNEGGLDGFVRRVDDHGATLWTHQFGSAQNDVIEAVAVAADGRVVAAGTTRGALEGASAGLGDAFVRVVDADGVEVWTRQFGSIGEEFALGVATGPGGRIAVVGGTNGDLANPTAAARAENDAFVRVVDADGDIVWTHQFGTAVDDHLNRVAIAGDGTVIVFGVTDGALAATNAGARDVFARAYGTAGQVLWTRQFGSEGSDYSTGVAVAGVHHVFVAGSTTGTLAGEAAGGVDAFVARLGPAGAITWLRQFGTEADDRARHVAIGPEGQAVVVGTTGGDLGGPSSGGDDVFLRAYGP